jgi:hypothetical protein
MIHQLTEYVKEYDQHIHGVWKEQYERDIDHIIRIYLSQKAKEFTGVCTEEFARKVLEVGE